MLHPSITKHPLFKDVTPMASLTFLKSEGNIGDCLLRPSRIHGDYFVLEILTAAETVEKILLVAPEQDGGTISIKYANRNNPVSLDMDINEFLQNLPQNLQKSRISFSS